MSIEGVQVSSPQPASPKPEPKLTGKMNPDGPKVECPDKPHCARGGKC